MHLLLDPITKRFFDFDGRASRKEFWIFYSFIFSLLIAFVSINLDKYEYIGLIIIIIVLISLIPLLSLQVRRLHDIGFSGYWILLNLLPLIGFLLYIFACFPSQKETNKYGPHPYENT